MVAEWCFATTFLVTADRIQAVQTATDKTLLLTGMRHMEVYDNQFLFPDHTCDNSCGIQCLSNVNQFIWIRGGTGVIFDNYFDHLSSQCWGTKTEIRFPSVERKMQGHKVPAPTRIIPCRIKSGKAINGTDPIWIWGNTGQSVVNVQTAWSWGNPCGFDWNTFFQWHRDAENTSLPNPLVLPPNGGGVSGLGGTPKPGYTPYTYPHPLCSGNPTPTPTLTPTSTPTATVTFIPSPTAMQPYSPTPTATIPSLTPTPTFTPMPTRRQPQLQHLRPRSTAATPTATPTRDTTPSCWSISSLQF